MLKNKFVVFLLSLVLAFGMWSYVVNNVSKEDTMLLENVPVVFQNEGALENHGLILTEGTGQTVDLSVTGNRNEVMKLHSGNVVVVVNLSQLYDAGRQSLQYTVQYPAEVNSSTFVYTADQSRVQVTLENLLNVSLPLEVIYEGELAPNYRMFEETEALNNIAGTPISSIRVSGPASVVRNMTKAVVNVDIEGMNQSIRGVPYPFTLCDSDGNPVEVPDVSLVTTNESEVELSLTIQGYKFIPFTVNTVDGKGATLETSKIEIEPQGITITGSDEALAAVETINLGDIDLGNYLTDTVLTLPINLPEGTTSLTEEVEAEVRLSFPDLMTKTFNLTMIQPVHVPAGTIPQVITPSITVTVRGPKTVVETMTEASFTVTADFGKLSIGVPDVVKPTVIIHPDFSGVGLLSVGNVNIRVDEPLPEPTEPLVDPNAEPAAQTEPTEPEAEG